MFNTYTNTYIDAFQEGKKQFISNAVKHEGLANIMNEFVDNQTKYTKSFVDATYQSMTNFGSLMMTKEFYSYDWLFNNKKGK